MRRAVSKIIPVKSNRHGNGGGSEDNTSYKLDHHSVDDFYIHLEDPHKTWHPGEEVGGQIIFISKKNLANIVITLSLVGYVKVNASSHSKLRSVKNVLFNHTIQIFGYTPQKANEVDSFQNGLYKGEHRFPFIVKLPNKKVFTSIDFGKGCIKYLLRGCIGDLSSVAPKSPSSGSFTGGDSPGGTNMASILPKKKNWKTLTNPTYTTEQTINLVTPIDVSDFASPKQKKLILKDPRVSRKLSKTQSSASTINTMNTYSTVSSNNSENNDEIGTQGNPTPQNANSPGEQTKSQTNTIKVSLEIPHGGYIRGELIPIKINVSHLRKIQDSNGIILTFVRVCRLDSGSDGAFESFRKDLRQSIIPLYVDPKTFNAEINTNIRVPPDAFSSISGCPLVSFDYFIEVLINLSGKSVLLDDGPNSTIRGDDTSHSAVYENQMIGDSQYNMKFGKSSNQVERSGYVNTDKYKRMKKFLQITAEVIIGTHRSNHNDNTHTNNSPEIQGNDIVPVSLSRRSSGSAVHDSPAPFFHTGSSSSQYSSHQSTPQVPPQNYIGAIPESQAVNDFSTPPYSAENNPYPEEFHAVPSYNNISFNNQSTNVPVVGDSNLTEKEMIRAHEMSLLPSAPPLDESNEDEEEASGELQDNSLNQRETAIGDSLIQEGDNDVEIATSEHSSNEEPKSPLTNDEGSDEINHIVDEHSELESDPPVN